MWSVPESHVFQWQQRGLGFSFHFAWWRSGQIPAAWILEGWPVEREMVMTDIHWSWAKVVLVQRRPDFPAISSYFQLWLGEDGPMVPTSVKSLCRKIASRPKWWFCNWLLVSGDFTREEPELESGGGYHLQRCGCDLWHWSFKKVATALWSAIHEAKLHRCLFPFSFLWGTV